MSESNSKTKIDSTVNEIKSSVSNNKKKKSKKHFKERIVWNSVVVSNLNVMVHHCENDNDILCTTITNNVPVNTTLITENTRKKKKSNFKPAQNLQTSNSSGEHKKVNPLQQSNQSSTQNLNNVLYKKKPESKKNYNYAKKENLKEMASNKVNTSQGNSCECSLSRSKSKNSTQPIVNYTDFVFSHLKSNVQKYSLLKSSNKILSTENSYHRIYSSMNALIKGNNNLPQLVQSDSKPDLIKKKTIENNKVIIEKPDNKGAQEKSKQDSIARNNFEKDVLNSNLQLNKESHIIPTSKPHLKEMKKQKKTIMLQNINEFPKLLSTYELASLEKFDVLMSGIIRINPKNYKEAYIAAPDKGQDIYIKGLKDRNRALHGDEVIVLLKSLASCKADKNSAESERTGVVVAIKALHHSRKAIGTLTPVKNEKAQFAQFCPRDIRVPKIRIRKNNWPKGFFEDSESFKNKLYFAKISGWNDMRFAEGELLHEVGNVGSTETETEALLLANNLQTAPYNETLCHNIPATLIISETEIKNREDLREECIFSIDPANAVDLDDALSCTLLPNGNYKVGVHIADVSHFLKEGTPLDKAVSERATTIYLVNNVYHMLPLQLCQLCSLTPGKDKLCLSVFWEITPDFQILNHSFAQTIIRSCAQLSYDQVQSIITNSPLTESELPKLHGPHTIENIKDIIYNLNRIAVDLRCKRFSNGALRINQKKIVFSLDEKLLPKSFKVEEHEESHQLVEEFMLLANITVAEKLFQQFPDIAFLRSHNPPGEFILNKYQKKLANCGVTLDVTSAGSLHASFLKYSGYDIKSVAIMTVLSHIMAKPMARANYYCLGTCQNDSDRFHYALNIPLYTHYTSPIRRYADIMVHRLLTAFVTQSDAPKWTIDHVQSIASNCNKQKYAAKLASEASTELFFAIYIELMGSIVCEAVVCHIQDKSFDCIVLSSGTLHRVYFSQIKGEIKEIKQGDIPQYEIKWPKDDHFENEALQKLEMFTIVKVELKRSSSLKIEALLLRSE